MSSQNSGLFLLTVVGMAAVLALVLIAWVRRRSQKPTRTSQGPQRLAELLLMEIKLARAEELEAARREKRILTTFEKELARARAMFEQHFPRGTPGWPTFDLEVVRSLAEGDGSALGPRPPSAF